MPDDPSKRSKDRHTAPKQPHEINYAIKQLSIEWAHKSRIEVAAAVSFCKTVIQRSKDREKLVAALPAITKAAFYLAGDD